MASADSLALFHPRIAEWFRETIGPPTDIQSRAWPRIAAGEHVLLTAPTGSGKTLTAFLWALNQLVVGKWPAGLTRVLYVSPLKALNADIRRNLLGPLRDLEKAFQAESSSFPLIRVQTRSGDTPQSERRRMLRHPPEILITTPESLNLLLSSHGGRTLLTGLATVILDEIHTVVGSKRGVHLITAVDRLIRLSGEFQRIALSATVKPLEKVAEFIGGFAIKGSAKNPSYTPRKVSLVRSQVPKNYRLRVRIPEETTDRREYEDFWKPIIQEFCDIIGRNRASLFFVRSRRQSESITLKINTAAGRPLAYAHHGSLAKELRHEVEYKLKEGALKAIVATNSLELGIDIGSLDEVILVQSPPSVSSAVQRIGRAGHRVGDTSRGAFYPTHDLDIMESAVLAQAVAAGNIESVAPVIGPLDVLAQILISMTGVETWDIDELFGWIRTSLPYRQLSRGQFDLVLNMLNGRYHSTRIRELKPRISLDGIENSAAARKGALLDLYLSGGTIPDRGYFHLRHQETGSLIGDLDEEFVWEADKGQTFTFGTQHWQIQRITHNDVFVLPAPRKTQEAPFWKGEVQNRDFHFSDRIGCFLEEANARLEDSDWVKELVTDYYLEKHVARHLADFLQRQKRETGVDLPHRHHLVVEHIQTGPGGTPGNQVVLHTFWGGRVNRPWAMALDAAWEERFGQRLEIYAADDCVVLLLAHHLPADELVTLATSDNLERFLRERLEGSGYFGARFRECAGRALLLSKRRMSERMPLWMSRLRSQKIFHAVKKLRDFPILLETWRTCLQDEFDIAALKEVLDEIASGTIQISACSTSHPSPMARSLAWRQIDQYMYASDAPAGDTSTGLRQDLLQEVVFSPGLRPAVSPEIVQSFEDKRQRLSPGYSPSSSRDLIDWVKERVLIPESEWHSLLAAIARDQEPEEETIRLEAEDRLVRLTVPEAEETLIVARESAARIQAGLFPGKKIEAERLAPQGAAADIPPSELRGNEEERDADAVGLLAEILQYYGPREPQWLQATFGFDAPRLQHILEDLKDTDAIITGCLITGSSLETLCDSENFETLLRMSRADAVPSFQPLATEKLALFMAVHQGLVSPAEDENHMLLALEKLSALPASAGLWETEFLPARAAAYKGAWLDTILRQTDLRWQGDGERRIMFIFEADIELLREDVAADPSAQAEATQPLEALFPDPAARYEFSILKSKTGLSADDLTKHLWEGVWGGRISNDSIRALRRGITSRYRYPARVPKTLPARRTTPRTGRRRPLSHWEDSQPYPGSWFLLPRPAVNDSGDLLAGEERRKERVRLLLERYGILFRELLVRELPAFRWKEVFRALRLMELSGEILSGYFFENIPGPQFVSHRAYRLLTQELPDDAVFWINAADPASLCGTALDALRGTLPKRVEGTHMVYQGSKLALVSQRKGKTVTISAPPDDDHLPAYLSVFRHMLGREFQPQRRIIIDTVNGLPAAESPYLHAFQENFDVVADIKHISLYRRVK